MGRHDWCSVDEKKMCSHCFIMIRVARDTWPAVRDSECVAAKDEPDININEKIDELHKWAFSDTKKSTSPATVEVPELPDIIDTGSSKGPKDYIWIRDSIELLAMTTNNILFYLSAKESRAKDAEPIPDMPGVLDYAGSTGKTYQLSMIRQWSCHMSKAVAALKRRVEGE